MQSFGFFLLMFLGGVTVAIQPSINARLAQKIGILESSAVSFVVGSLALLAIVLIAGRGSFKGLATAHSWELTGGLMGAFFVTLTIMIVPRIGTTATMVATIAAQLITGIILDHFGLFGFRSIPLDLKRGVGAGLLLIGATLIFRR